MKNKDLMLFESKFLRAKPLPRFRAGDTVCVWYKVREGSETDGSPAKYRLQPYEGLVIRYRHDGPNSTFLVRKTSAGGIGVERNFYAHSHLVDRVEVKLQGRVRRARLYYVRRLRGKAARITSRYVAPSKLESESQAATPSA